MLNSKGVTSDILNSVIAIGFLPDSNIHIASIPHYCVYVYLSIFDKKVVALISKMKGEINTLLVLTACFTFQGHVRQESPKSKSRKTTADSTLSFEFSMVRYPILMGISPTCRRGQLPGELSKTGCSSAIEASKPGPHRKVQPRTL